MKELTPERRLENMIGKSVWNKLTPTGKTTLLREFSSQYDKETETIKKTVNTLREYYRTVGSLVLGVMLGVVGSFFAGAFERLIQRYWGGGVNYDVMVLLSSSLALFLVIRVFDKESENILRSNKKIEDLFVDEK